MQSIELISIRPDFFSPRADSGLWDREIAVGRGETLLVHGASGRGKTSALLFAAGARFDYQGSVLWDGQDARRLRDGERSAALKCEIALVFQDLMLIAGLTARQNIEIKRLVAPFHDAGAAQAMAERLGIGGVLGNAAKHLSRGEQQRVAIVRALVQPFDFILLDEPFSHLDAEAAREASALIEEERARRGAALVLFDVEDASRFRGARRVEL